MLEMDDETLRWHNSRLTQEQYEVLNDKLTEIMGAEMNTELGGPTRIPEHIRTLMFFLYMANQNSFRELDDIFTLHKSTAYDVVIQVLAAICHMALSYIKWPNLC